MRLSAIVTLFVAAVLVSLSCGKTEQGVREVHTLDEATALASGTGAYIVAEFYSPT